MRINAHTIEIGTPINLGPCRLTIERDASPENPWRDWDFQTPLAWRAGGHHEPIHLEDSGDGILNPLDDVSPRWTSRHWRALCDILDLDAQAHDSDARAQARDYGEPLGDVRLELFREALDDMAGDSWKAVSDYFAVLAAIWELRGVPALAFQRNGYSQGDSVLGLLVATPAHAARCGFDLKSPGHDIREALKRDADLFGAWAFGDVYGYIIEDDSGDVLDSCWGFYGCPWGNNPERGGAWAVLDAARDALRDIAHAQVRKAQAAAEAAHVAFLEGKAEARAAQAQGFRNGRLCNMVQGALKAEAETWRNATRRARAWAALAADLDGADLTDVNLDSADL